MPGVDWAGTYDLSWWDLQEFIRYECRDSTSALWRKINPEYESPDEILARFTAQAVADVRWLLALNYADEEGHMPEILERFGMYDLSPDDGESSEEHISEASKVEWAREAAAQLLA